jgi:hypothetical protein
MAIAVEDSGNADGNATSLIIGPTGGAAASGEVIYIAATYVGNSSNSNDFPTAYALTGFTQIGAAVRKQAAELTVWRKVAGGSEPTTYTLTWSGIIGTFYNIGGTIIVYSGVDNTTPEGTPVTLNDGGTVTAWTIPALTTTAANSYDTVFISNGGNATPTLSGWDSSLVERAEQSSDFATSGIASVARASAGVQAAANVTASAADSRAVMRIEVLEAAAPSGGFLNRNYWWGND